MADRANHAEARLIRAVFPGELAERCLAIPSRPDGKTVLRQLRRQVRAALATLSYRERGILEMRYGFGDGYAYTLAEAGYVFRLTRERIRQLQARAVRRLRLRAGDLRRFLETLAAEGNGAY